MNWKRWTILVTAAMCLLLSSAHAQRGADCTLKGSLRDSLSQEGIEYATVKVLRGDSLVSGAISDDKGNWEVKGLAPATYRLEIAHLSYDPRKLGPVSLTAERPVRDLGAMNLQPKTIGTTEVQITDRQDLMLNNIDKKVYSMERNQLAAGGAATDVLKNIPSVEVDIDGNLTLRGNANVTILIDGKPSALTGAGRNAILNQIPASSIKSIEVITNPSARFDPDGMAGIINITTKKDKGAGLNANVSVGVGTHNKYNASVGLNYRAKHFNTYFNYSTRYEDRWSKGISTTITPADTISPELDQASNGNRNTYDNVLRGGIDIFLGKWNTLSLGGGGTYALNRAWDNNHFEELDPAGQPWSQYLRREEETTIRPSYDGEINFSRRYERVMRSLDLRAAYSVGIMDEDDDFRTQHWLDAGLPSSLPDDNQLNFLNDRIGLGTFQLDYVDPWNEKNKVEAGAKVTTRDITNGFRSETYDYSLEQFRDDTLLNNDFLYDERILAAYGIWTHRFTKSFGVQVGLRLEEALTRSQLAGSDTAFTRNYFNPFPNSYLYYNKQYSKSTQEWRLSYSRRINRPTTEQLNPFTDYSNPKRLRIGNPQLLPEYIDAFELSWNRRASWGSINASGYFRYLSNSHTRYFEPIRPGSDTVLITFLNLIDGQSYGLELIAETKPFKWMDLMLSANGFRTIMNAGNLEPDLTVDALGLNTQLTSTIFLGKQTSFQLSANYKSPRYGPQGVFAATFTSDVSVKRNLFKGKGALTFRVSDWSNTQRFRIDPSTDVLQGSTWRKRESRVAYLTFTYRVGKGDFMPKRKKQDERNEGGGMDF